MLSQQKLPSLWVCLLIMAAFYPGAQYVHGKRGSSSWKKSSSSKVSSSEGSDLSKQGLKVAGAAAAAAGAGYASGILGQSRRRSGSSSHDENFYYNPHGYYNKTQWYITASAGAPGPTKSLTLGCVVSSLVGVWIRGV